MASVKAKPLRGKVRFRASSLNVGTLTDRSAEVVETLTRRKVDLCCLQIPWVLVYADDLDIIAFSLQECIEPSGKMEGQYGGKRASCQLVED